MKHVLMTEDELRDLFMSCIEKYFQNKSIVAPEKKNEDELMTVEEASGFLNLAVTTIYEKTSKKLIPFFKRDKKLYFKKSELENWILEGKVNCPNETQKGIIKKLPELKKHKNAA